MRVGPQVQALLRRALTAARWREDGAGPASSRAIRLAFRTVSPYIVRMVIRSVRHRGLRRLLEQDNPRYLRPDHVGRIRNVVTALILADHIDDFAEDAPRGWHVHRLGGDRRDEWSVSVSGNFRITFEEEDGWIDRLNLEDYH